MMTTTSSSSAEGTDGSRSLHHYRDALPVIQPLEAFLSELRFVFSVMKFVEIRVKFNRTLSHSLELGLSQSWHSTRRRGLKVGDGNSCLKSVTNLTRHVMAGGQFSSCVCT